MRVDGETARCGLRPAITCACALVALLQAAVPTATVAQGTAVLVPDDVSCDACSIELEHVQRIGSLDGSGFLESPPNVVVRKADGRFVVQVPGVLRVMVFEPDGGYERDLARKGQGPRDLEAPGVLLSLPGDSLAVFDSGNARITIYDPQLRWVRTGRNPVPHALDAVVLDDGQLVVNGPVPTPEGIGLPLHVLAFSEGHDGRIERSTGSLTGALRSQVDAARRLATDGSTVWAAHYNQYLIERWTATGERVQTIRRSPEWFSGRHPLTRGSPGQPPNPRVSAITVDSEGLIWVFSWRPSNYWERAWRNISVPSSGEISGGSRRPTTQELYNTQIDVIDPVAGTLVASRTWAGLVKEVVGPGLLHVEHRGNYDEPYVDIWRVRLDGLSNNHD